MCDRLIVYFLIKNGKSFFFREKMGKVIYIYIYIYLMKLVFKFF